ncbi:MAG: hypothetical protein MRZ75_07160 [Roseburia sp.]|nr:hypothetical protein [Roseburia sp.]MDY5884262.1 HK97-gp10 family putative phage morphogenesis protein [Roseburia sp.]
MSGEISFFDSGLDEFQEMIEEYSKMASEDEVLDVLQTGAEAFVKDLLSLPKPKSNIHAAGYTHIVNTFALQRDVDEIKVGWGKYYGPMLEHGTKYMAARQHLSPLFSINKEKYYKLMIHKLKFD